MPRDGHPERAPDEVAEAAPVHDWLTREDFFRVVTGHQEAVDLLSDHRMHADLAAMFAGAGFRSGPVWEAATASLLSLNGPRHREYRSIIAPHFTPRAVERIRPSARRAAATTVDALLTGSRCEVVRDFAEPYVTDGICEHVGFSTGEVAELSWAIQQLGWAAKDLHNRAEECTEAMVRLVDYAREAIRTRTAEPTDDVLGLLAEAVTSGRLPEQVATVLVSSLLSAGHEPTTNQVALMVLTLSDHPDLWDAVGTGATAVGPVVEELLRYRSTNVCVNRRVDEALDYGGVGFAAGEQVLISLDAANHDPRRYPAPHDVDPEANQGSHLAFGFGAHYCLGAALSRVQLQEALVALTSRLACPRVLEHVPHEGAGLRGPISLTISVAPRQAA